MFTCFREMRNFSAREEIPSILFVYFLKLEHPPCPPKPPCSFCLRTSELGSLPSSFTGSTVFIQPQTDPNVQVIIRNLDIKILKKTYFCACPCQLETYHMYVCMLNILFAFYMYTVESILRPRENLISYTFL